MSDRESRRDPPPTAGGPDLVEFERRAVRWWHPLLLLAVLAALYFVGQRLGVAGELGRLLAWIEAAGPLGPLVFVLVYVVLTVLGLPGSPLTAAAGALFGAAIGIPTSLVASTATATLCFLIARHLAPQRLRRRLTASRSFQHLDRLVARRGPLVVLATRLVNLLPFALVNYGFGFTRIRLGTYVLWSILGKIPGTIVLVLGADVVVDALRFRRVSWRQVALVIALALALGLVVRWTSRWLSEDEEPDQSPADQQR